MKRIALLPAVVFALSTGTGQTSAPSDSALSITGDVAIPVVLSLSDLMKLPHHVVRAVDHDNKEHAFDGVDVYRLLGAAGLRFADTLKGRAFASSVLIVRALDGYQAAFSLAELDPTNTQQQVVLAYKKDGKSLSDKEGKLRVIAGGDERHIRWVRQVKSFVVQRLN